MEPEDFAFAASCCKVLMPDAGATVKTFGTTPNMATPAKSLAGSYLKLGGANIFIAEVKPGDGVNPPPATPYQGLDHFGLAVSGIDAIAAELKSKGVQFSKEPHVPRPGLKICFLRGPQGISIELLDRDPKYTSA